MTYVPKIPRVISIARMRGSILGGYEIKKRNVSTIIDNGTTLRGASRRANNRH